MIGETHGRARFVSVAEERLNRQKDSRSFPRLSVAACMDELGVRSVDEIDLIAMDYIVRPDWRADWNRKPCDTDNFLAEVDPSRICVINHHLAHARAVFHSSRFDSAAVLIIDGRGSDKETQSLFRASPGGIELLDSTTTIGVGLAYAAVTHAIGFGLLQEGKTMGLAPYGADSAPPVFDIPSRYEGVVTDYSAFCVEGNYEIQAPHRPIETFDDRARAAFEVQHECEAAMLHLAQYARDRTGETSLCVSGGVALNSVANWRIVQSGIFEDVFINPAASDTGIALGAALHGYHGVLGRPRSYDGISPYVGPSYGPDSLAAAIESHDGYRVVETNVLGRAVELLAANRVVACFHGRSEMGPRALGNRSILMSPLVAENKDTLNRRVKHREPFRPFAPAVMEEHAREYFHIDRPSPYMLLVPAVVEDKRDVIPAVTHVDGTGRLQTVRESDNANLYALIDRFNALTGVPVLLNTSFNVANEPIVETPEDAIRCFVATGIDALLMGDRLLIKDAADAPIA
jgi:carbamoyltransferase